MSILFKAILIPIQFSTLPESDVTMAVSEQSLVSNSLDIAQYNAHPIAHRNATIYISNQCKDDNILQQEICQLTHLEVLGNVRWDIEKDNFQDHSQIISLRPGDEAPKTDPLSITDWMRILPIY